MNEQFRPAERKIDDACLSNDIEHTLSRIRENNFQTPFENISKTNPRLALYIYQGKFTQYLRNHLGQEPTFDSEKEFTEKLSTYIDNQIKWSQLSKQLQQFQEKERRGNAILMNKNQFSAICKSWGEYFSQLSERYPKLSTLEKADHRTLNLYYRQNAIDYFIIDPIKFLVLLRTMCLYIQHEHSSIFNHLTLTSRASFIYPKQIIEALGF